MSSHQSLVAAMADSLAVEHVGGSLSISRLRTSEFSEVRVGGFLGMTQLSPRFAGAGGQIGDQKGLVSGLRAAQ